MNNVARLLPEWHQQEAVILAWPDENTDWAPWLGAVRQSYLQLINAITANQTGVILLVREQQLASAYSALKDCKNLLLLPADYNDTWCRDYCFLTLFDGTNMQPFEYQFNGWGNKFDASKDNQVNHLALQSLCKHPLQSQAVVAEGGALEIDQHGHLLSTALCLLNPQRNQNMTLAQYQQQFSQDLGASQVSILQQGHLHGDDTDGHIDTLVRFAPDNHLLVQACFNRPDDIHFAGLDGLVTECKALLPEHHIHLLPLPNVVNQDGERLPASYANFLINNQQVLCPIYQQPEDQLALDVIQQAFPGFEIVAIDSLPLIQQFGSVHCISMQVPQGTLHESVKQCFDQQARVWENQDDNQ